jgi:outer membrane protein OmpA-like peptidoglycan-associated protein
LLKLTKFPQVNILRLEGRGEAQSKDNQNPEGEAEERRVDLILLASSQNTNVNTRPVSIEGPGPAEQKPELVAGKKLSDIQIGQSIELEGLSFVPGKHIILDASVTVLFDLLETLKQNPKLKIEIQGHVCCIEDSKPDALDYGTGERILSVNRAKAVFDFLIKNGIDRTRLKYRGFGHKHPKVSPETSPDDEQQNRRVEIMLLEK